MKTERLIRSRWAAIGAAVAVTLGAGGIFAAGALPPGTPSSFEPLSPTRILNTRAGVGAPLAKLGAGKEIVLQVTGGSSGVPTDATSVVLNMTATNASQDSFITVYPFGETRPDASVLNFKAGEDVPNMITVKLGTDGKVVIYNDRGTVDVIADTAGYFRPQSEAVIRWGRFDSQGTLQDGNLGINIPRILGGLAGTFRATGGADWNNCGYTVSANSDSARIAVTSPGITANYLDVSIFDASGNGVYDAFSVVETCPGS